MTNYMRAMPLLFLLALTAAADVNADETKDIWREIKSIDEMIGVWETDISYPIEGIPDSPLLMFGFTFSVFGNTENFVFDMRLDYEKILSFMVLLSGNTYTKDALWEEFTEDMKDTKEVLIGNYYIQMVLITPHKESNKFARNVYFVNQDRTKLKCSGSNAFSDYLHQDEIILMKKERRAPPPR